MESGRSINNEQLTKLGHRLLCIFFAAYDFETFYRESDAQSRDPDPLDGLRKFEEDEITETLLTLAALARAYDDEYGFLGSAGEVFPDGVGTLTTEKGCETLTLREACNKIVHARSLVCDLARGTVNPIWSNFYRAHGYMTLGEFKAPAIIMNGTRQNGSAWEARLELVPFIYGVAIENISFWNIV